MFFTCFLSNKSLVAKGRDLVKSFSIKKKRPPTFQYGRFTALGLKQNNNMGQLGVGQLYVFEKIYLCYLNSLLFTSSPMNNLDRNMLRFIVQCTRERETKWGIGKKEILCGKGLS